MDVLILVMYVSLFPNVKKSYCCALLSADSQRFDWIFYYIHDHEEHEDLRSEYFSALTKQSDNYMLLDTVFWNTSWYFYESWKYLTSLQASQIQKDE